MGKTAKRKKEGKEGKEARSRSRKREKKGKSENGHHAAAGDHIVPATADQMPPQAVSVFHPAPAAQAAPASGGGEGILNGITLTEVQQKELQQDVHTRLSTINMGAEESSESRDMLAEFAVCMVAAKKKLEELREELELFLGPDQARSMADWIAGHVQE